MSFWDKNKFFEKLLIFSWIAILFFCLFFLSFTSHASSSSSLPLPFYVDYYHNSYFTDSFIIDDSIKPSLESYGFYFLSDIYDQNSSYVWIYAYVPRPNTTYTFTLKNHDLNQTVSYQDFDFGHDYVVMSGSFNRYMLRMKRSEGTFKDAQVSLYTGNFDFSLLGRDSTSINSLGYTPMVPYYISDNLVYSDFENNILFTNGEPETDPEILTGHATPPNSFDDPVVNSGSNHTLPREVPESPTINNYTWITYNPPVIDTSNVESLLESLIYVINYLAGWLRDNFAGEFLNLISNITGLINYIVETIQYYGGLIISNIQNGIETFYNNMVSLFEPISNTISYISEPVSGSVIYDNISGTSLVANITSVNTALTSFKTSFDNLSEPTSFSIPIHLENLPSAYFGNQTTQYIDLSIIGSTEKGIIRTFMWAIVTYGLFITIVDSISNYINGGGDES